MTVTANRNGAWAMFPSCTCAQTHIYEVQGHLQLYSAFETILSYLRSCFRKSKKTRNKDTCVHARAHTLLFLSLQGWMTEMTS